MDEHPDRLGPYRIERRIGAGGMGTVYLGRHDETGERFALKVLPAALAREDGFIPRFRREIDSLRKLTNPHIVQFHESGVDGDLHYYAMEYVEGETLASRLVRDRRVSWRETVHIGIQICSALKAAHDAGVIHRDLKPSNLLVDTMGEVKLTDFGIAHVFAGTQLTADGGIVGTAEFMSPEQAKGTRVTKQSDLYALGAVMYILLTGRPPFSGKTARAVMDGHLHGQFDRPRRYVPDLPHDVDDVVCQLLEKEPEKRPPDAYVLSRTLQQIISKIDLSSAISETAAAMPTRAANEPQGGDGVRGPGAATFVRDYVKAEVERTQRRSAFSRFLDNTWVLLVLFALVVGTTYWLWQSSALTAEEHLEAAAAALEAAPGPNWLTARDEHLLPLLEEDPETWEPRVRPLLDEIERYEFEQRFSRSDRLRVPVRPGNDAERFLLRAQRQRDAGDYAAALDTLTRLQRLLESTGTHEATLKLVEGTIDETRMDQLGKGRDPLLENALKLAEQHLAAGEVDDAEELLADAANLYADDPDATSRIDELTARIDGSTNPADDETSNPEAMP